MWSSDKCQTTHYPKFGSNVEINDIAHTQKGYENFTAHTMRLSEEQSSLHKQVKKGLEESRKGE